MIYHVDHDYGNLKSKSRNLDIMIKSSLQLTLVAKLIVATVDSWTCFLIDKLLYLCVDGF